MERLNNSYLQFYICYCILLLMWFVVAPAARKKKALALTRDLLADVADHSESDPSTADSVAVRDPGDQPPPSKKTRIENFEDLCDADDTTLPVRNELADYVNFQVPKDTDIMKFWSDNRTHFPKLCLVARRVLCIPATSTPSERVFSTAGRVLEKRRTSLSTHSVNSLLFLHSNMKCQW